MAGILPSKRWSRPFASFIPEANLTDRRPLSIKGNPPSKGWRPFVRLSLEANTYPPRPFLPTLPRSGMTKGSLDSRNPESTSLLSGPFRENFTFVTPLSFQRSVASDPVPPPGSRWKYSVSVEETNAVPSPESPDPKSLYVFGKKDEIRDLEMEDGPPGVANTPLVTGAHQIVSVWPASAETPPVM